MLTRERIEMLLVLHTWSESRACCSCGWPNKDAHRDEWAKHLTDIIYKENTNA